ncbi:hypothetical protein B4U80_14193 [Leptotrombidium deliense]|uniref:F-box domain-containing protein n=1 Tax=Leptotrombidium deliense TaxID=299467 RepID=A0A443S0F9_9ACAR|nr:hypothetical protein B4U80_14193 [Leptotrombidium deliense]
MIKPFPFQKFPNEIQVELLSKLEEKELIVCRLVSQIWKHCCDYLLKRQKTSLCVCRAFGGWAAKQVILYLLENVMRTDARFVNQCTRIYYTVCDVPRIPPSQESFTFVYSMFQTYDKYLSLA